MIIGMAELIHTYQKRISTIKSPKYGRKYMGRKGIGKLSMFSIAREVDVISRKSCGDHIEENAFRMNLDTIGM